MTSAAVDMVLGLHGTSQVFGMHDPMSSRAMVAGTLRMGKLILACFAPGRRVPFLIAINRSQ